MVYLVKMCRPHFHQICTIPDRHLEMRLTIGYQNSPNQSPHGDQLLSHNLQLLVNYFVGFTKQHTVYDLMFLVIPVPIIPSINTCMSLTTTTTTTSSSSSGTTPVVSSNQLQALAEVCSTVGVSCAFPNCRVAAY